MMHRVCLCLPRQLAQLGEAVVSKCSDAVTQKIKFTQCDVDDPGRIGHFFIRNKKSVKSNNLMQCWYI